jgi:hypothetical protein
MTLEEKYEKVCASLLLANSQTERFEREYYLLKDEVEELRKKQRSNVEDFICVGRVEEDYSDGANPYRIVWGLSIAPFSAGTKLYVSHPMPKGRGFLEA